MAPRPHNRDIKNDLNQKSAALSRPLAASKMVAQKKIEENQTKKNTFNIISTSKVEVNNRVYHLHSSVYSCPLRSVGDPDTECDFVITKELFKEQLSWEQFMVNGRDGVAAAKHLLDVHNITVRDMSDILQYPHSKYTFTSRIVGRREYLRIKLEELGISEKSSRKLGKYFERMCCLKKLEKKKTEENMKDVLESMEKINL